MRHGNLPWSMRASGRPVSPRSIVRMPPVDGSARGQSCFSAFPGVASKRGQISQSVYGLATNLITLVIIDYWRWALSCNPAHSDFDESEGPEEINSDADSSFLQFLLTWSQ